MIPNNNSETFELSLEDRFSSYLDDCNIGEMREIFSSLSKERCASLLRSNEVKIGFDLMLKSYQEDAHPSSVYNTISHLKSGFEFEGESA